MKILVFGTGDYYQRYKNFFIEDIVGFIDNNESKQGTFQDGIEIMSPVRAVSINYDRIYVLSVFYKEMTNQLLELGIKKEKIFSPTEVVKLLRAENKHLPITVVTEDRKNLILAENKKNVLILTPNLRLNGAVIALLGAVRACVKNGFDVTVGAFQTGAAQDILVRQYGVKVVIDENLLFCTMRDTKWVQNSSVILCNTIFMYQFLSERNKGIPIIWWLHDPPYVYETIDHNVTKDIDFSDVKAFGAGRIAGAAFDKEFSGIHSDILLYGLEDSPGNKQIADNCFNVITVGEIQDWKGQDIFCEAAKKVLSSIKKQVTDKRHCLKIRFLLIGNDTTKFASVLKAKYAEFPEIQFLGIFSRAEMRDIYNHTNLYICPSREETMSITVTEAMMKNIPCIVSDAAGIADFVHNETDGLVFHAEHADDLAQKLSWCLSNREKIEEMGRKGRKIFERNFSERVFEEHFMKIMKNI